MTFYMFILNLWWHTCEYLKRNSNDSSVWNAPLCQWCHYRFRIINKGHVNSWVENDIWLKLLRTIWYSVNVHVTPAETLCICFTNGHFGNKVWKGSQEFLFGLNLELRGLTVLLCNPINAVLVDIHSKWITQISSVHLGQNWALLVTIVT